MAFLLVTSDGHRGDVIRNVTVEQWQNAKFETLQDGTKCCTVSVWEHKTSTKMGAAVMVISNPRARRCILAFHDYVRPIFFTSHPDEEICANAAMLQNHSQRVHNLHNRRDKTAIAARQAIALEASQLN